MKVGIVPVYPARSGDELFDAQVHTYAREVLSHVFVKVEPLHSVPQVLIWAWYYCPRVVAATVLGSKLCPAPVESRKVIANAIKFIVHIDSILGVFLN